MKPIIVLGAGLSGLACARKLASHGQQVLLIEAKSKVGGRVSSRRTANGFLIDEGFQVLLSSYPELQAMVSLKSLKLRPFFSGALIFDGQGLGLLANPFRHPGRIRETLKFPYASLKDKCLVGSLMISAQSFRNDQPLGSQSTLDFLKEYGFSSSFIDNFWIPFLSGVYLDPNLSIGAGFFRFLIRCFGWGEVCLPEEGMEQLPIQIASRLPQGSIRLNTRSKSWTATEVTLESGEKIESAQVICAFDEREQNHGGKPLFRKVTTYYFTSPQLNGLGWEKWLILVPPRLGMTITHMALISSVSQSYGLNEKPLLSVSVIGSNSSDQSQVAQEVEKIAGKSLSLEWVTTTEVPRALPILSKEPAGFELKEGVIYCGDRYASPSINGALRSGRLAAQTCLDKL